MEYKCFWARVDLVFKFILADMEELSLCNMAEVELHEGEEHLADEVCWEQGATTLQQDKDNRVPGNLIETVSLVGFNGGWST